MFRWWRILFLGCGAALAAGAADRPNFIVILADDLGYGDVGFNGATTIATPRLDRMAREGIRFSAGYTAAPFCSPSRAALLTGRLPARAGLPYVLFPAENHGLPRAEITLAALLRTRGYATACIGKWHLGWAPEFRPPQHGFDVFFGTPYSNDSNEWPVGEPFIPVMGLEPFPLVDGDTVIEAPADQATLTLRYTERAVRFIRENRNRPFFLYLPHTMPHIPQHASPRFAGRSRGGLYGDTIEELDWSTGVILDTLRELDLDERTIVVFTSDNGASTRPGSGRAAGSTPAAKGGKKAKAAAPPAAPKADRFPGRSFGGSNGPLRAGKGTTWEGGVRVPWVLRWPGTVAPGREVADAVSLLDLFPTFAALAGAAPPADRTYDGRDLGPVLRGGREAEPRTVYHYFGYQPQAIREGRWKLFVRTDRRPDPVPSSLWFVHQPRLFENQHRLLATPQLYDLEADPGESRDVAARHPGVVHRLTERMAAFDAALQRDCRPMEFVPGPQPPEPQTVRTPETDLSALRRR